MSVSASAARTAPAAKARGSERVSCEARIKAHLAGAGLDWMSVGSDGYWRPDVHAQFLPDDAAVILMHYTGLVQQTERFAAGADADQPTGWADQYVRLACASKPGLSNFYGSTPTCSSPRADYWEPVTLSTRCTDAVTVSPMAHSATRITPALSPSARSTSRRTQSACRTDRPADTPHRSPARQSAPCGACAPPMTAIC